MAEHEPHIVLYFDVNKTVIMHDPVQGKGLHHILNDLLTERAFGFASDDGETWTWNGEPVLSTEHSSGHQRDAITYGMFLRAKVRKGFCSWSYKQTGRLKRFTQYPMSSDPAEAKHNKKMRKLLRRDFTAPGNPGHGFAHEHDALLAKLRLPSLSDSPARQSNDHDTAIAAAGLDTDSGYFFVIPAFFRFLQFLHERGTKFNLVFRTYGDDLHRIAQEFNLFCIGKHPFFSPGTTLMDGSDGSVDRRLHLSTADGSDHRFGTFFRGAQDTTVLVMGTFQQPKTVDEDHTLFYQQQHQLLPNAVQIIHGMDAIHGFLTKRWRDSQATLALRDFYPFWFHHVEDPRAGKLLTVDETDQSVHAIFFDDNILAHEPHIVDARFVPDGQSIAWERARELYLLRVEPLEAVRDETYFIHRFLASLDKRSNA